MNLDGFLAEIECLRHSDRVRRLVDLGRASTIDADARSLLTSLRLGEPYHRWLALQSCYGSRDGALVAEALTDHSGAVCKLAVAIIPLVCNDAEAQYALSVVPSALHEPLLQALRRRDRQSPIDAHLTHLSVSRDRRLHRLLAYGSPELTATYLASVIEQFDRTSWRRLTRLHPDLAANALESRASAGADDETRLTIIVATVFPLLSKLNPDRALGLVSILTGRLPIGNIPLQELADRRPREVADWMLNGVDPPLVSFKTRVRSLDVEQLTALNARFPSVLGDHHHWIPQLGPAASATLFSRFGLAWRTPDGWLDSDLIACLPIQDGIKEARRSLRLPSVQGSWSLKLDYAALLPWDEARIACDKALHSPESDERGYAMGSLVTAAECEPVHLINALALMHDLRNDQDPVRKQFLNALSNASPNLWRAEHLEPLGRVVRDALDAADLSASSTTSLQRMLSRLLPNHPVWAANQLATIAKERRATGAAWLTGLSRISATELAAAFQPIIDDWNTGGQTKLLTELAEGLGPRVDVWPELVRILQRQLVSTREATLAERILALFQRRRPDRLGALVPELLKTDPSWIRRQTVQTHLQLRRQDLLTPFLAMPLTPGRFDSGESRHANSFTNGVNRWTAAQQGIYREALEQMTGSPAGDPSNALYAVKRLVLLAWLPPHRLLQLAALDNTGIAVRDTTLLALGRMDRPEAEDCLIDALGDDRARVAIYALRRRLLASTPEVALLRLMAVPTQRVTVAKEVVRLIGDLPIEAAFDSLIARDTLQLHRDVRIALLRALWNWTQKEEAWRIFERAAVGSDGEIASGVAWIPSDGLTQPLRARLATLICRLLSHADENVRRNAAIRLHHQPIEDPSGALRAPLFASIISPFPDEATIAAGTLFRLLIGRDNSAIVDVIGQLAHDRPKLALFTDEMTSTGPWRSADIAEVLAATLDLLRSDPNTVALRAQLAVRLMSAADLAEFFIDLAARNELHAEVVIRSCDEIDGRLPYHLVNGVSYGARHTVRARSNRSKLAVTIVAQVQSGRHQGRGNLEDADDVIDQRFGNQINPGLRRIAFAALMSSAKAGGWTTQRRDRLKGYQNDPSPLVAEPALCVELPLPDAPEVEAARQEAR